MQRVVRPGGTLILLDTLGTGVELPECTGIWWRKRGEINGE
jgi:hypothetical protein